MLTKKPISREGIVNNRIAAERRKSNQADGLNEASTLEGMVLYPTRV